MVAGGRFRGEDEQCAAQHQSRRRGDLGEEAVVEDRLGAGETRGLGARIEPGRQIDEKGDPQAQPPQQEDDPPNTNGRRADLSS